MTASKSLEALLAPRSIAVVGASTTAGSFGRYALEQVHTSGFKGPIYAVNPKYREIGGTPCVSSLSDLPRAPEHIVLAVPNEAVEKEIETAISIGAKSATIFASCYLPSDGESTLVDRLRQRCDESGFLLCGANCLGFYNLEQHVRSSWYPYGHLEAGSIAAVSHSGSVFVSLAGLDPRLRFNLIVSAGQEINVTAADYMEHALTLPSTRVIALFLEAIRDPIGFQRALESAASRRIPVVALKVGRTAMSAELSRSHSGAIAGSDAAFEALTERYGVVRVKTLDELAATVSVLGHHKRATAGRGIAAVHDSGGERSMAVDVAADLGVPYAQISETTSDILKSQLDFGLLPVNPLDVWGTGNNFDAVFKRCFGALLDDEDTALGFLFSDLGRGGTLDRQWADLAVEVSVANPKPLFIVQNFSRTLDPAWLADVTHRGTPVIDGTENALLAARHALNYRDFVGRPKRILPSPPAGAIVEKWRARLTEPRTLPEAEVLALFRDFGITTPRVYSANTADSACAAFREIGCPIALKTATDGILHKSDVGGVRLGIRTEDELRDCYRDMATRLGPNVLVSEMCPRGTELSLGMVSDEQFGPLVVLSAGGVLIELLGDRAVRMAPLTEVEAVRSLTGLRVSRLLEGYRGQPAANIPSLSRIISRFSLVASTLGDLISELDANPIIATESGAWAADGLLIQKASRP